MLKTSFDLLSFFSTELFSVTFSHAEHITHATEEASALLLITGFRGLTCLCTSIYFSIAAPINLQKES